MSAPGPDFSVVRWTLPHTVTIIPTYKCTAECAHCCFGSNPRISHRVPQSALLSYIDEAKQLGTVRLICFTGGEVFLLGKDLVELVQRVASHGMMSRIVSNGYWAATYNAARYHLEPLVRAGLTEINFSTGDNHAQFIPVDFVVNGMAAAFDLGLGLALMVEDQEVRQITRSAVFESAVRFPVLLDALNDKTIGITDSPWMPFSENGGVSATLPTKPTRVTLSRKTLHVRKGCDSIFTTLVVTPREQLGICCGLPREDIKDLNIGSLREASMASLFKDSLSDFLKIWLFVDGPERILAWAGEKDPRIMWEDMYAHQCDACRRLFTDEHVMSVIAKFGAEKLGDVMSRFALYTNGMEYSPAQASLRAQRNEELVQIRA